MKKCLACYEEIPEIENGLDQEYHVSCSKNFYGKSAAPILEYSRDDLVELAKNVLKKSSTVTGVQAKLSLGILKMSDNTQIDRFTIVGLLGDYILKTPSEIYSQLPEIEGITMKMAENSGISTVKQVLVRLKSGELCYLTKRIDRLAKKGKLHMEDMCQLTERQTEQKYKGSYEQIAKAIRKYSENPGLDVVNFYEVVLFSFLTGNNDMHLKNFSLIKNPELGYVLSPAYDLVASQLVIKNDPDQLALSLNGKRGKIKRKDFIQAMENGGVNEKAIENIFSKFQAQKANWENTIPKSFLTLEFQEDYIKVLTDRFKQLEL